MLRYALLTALTLALSFGAEVAGKWKIHSESSSGQQTDAIIEVREDWGAWNAVLMVGDDKIPLRAVTVEDDKLSFEVPTSETTYTVKVLIKGDGMEGTFTATDGQKGKLTGKRE